MHLRPIKAITHIQNTAPGPPSTIAVATPAILPVPTREPRLIANAWNGDIPFHHYLMFQVSRLKL